MIWGDSSVCLVGLCLDADRERERDMVKPVSLSEALINGLTLLRFLDIWKFQTKVSGHLPHPKPAPIQQCKPLSPIRGTNPLLSREQCQVRKRNVIVSSCPGGCRESPKRKQKALSWLLTATKGLRILGRVPPFLMSVFPCVLST